MTAPTGSRYGTGGTSISPAPSRLRADVRVRDEPVLRLPDPSDPVEPTVPAVPVARLDAAGALERFEPGAGGDADTAATPGRASAAALGGANPQTLQYPSSMTPVQPGCGQFMTQPPAVGQN
jgi:hypothetical protein